MFGNYLGINGKPSKKPEAKYGRVQEKATPSTKCQKCLKLGHYSYSCTGQREYKVRPTRTQILKNPKLRTQLTASLPPRTEEMPKEGTAAGILAANEAKRTARLKAASRRSSSFSSSSGSSSSSSRSSSSGSDSGSDSDGDDGGRRRRRRSERSESPEEGSKRRRTSEREERDEGKGKGRAERD